MRSAQNRDLGGQRDYLEGAVLADAFSRLGRSVRPSDDAGRYLVDLVAAFLSGAQSFPPREWRVCGYARRRTHVPASVVIAISRLRSGGS